MERKIQLRKSLSRSQAYVGRVGRTDPNDDKRPLRTLTPFSRATPDPAVGTRSRAIRRCASRRHFRFCPANSYTIQGCFAFSLSIGNASPGRARARRYHPWHGSARCAQVWSFLTRECERLILVACRTSLDRSVWLWKPSRAGSRTLLVWGTELTRTFLQPRIQRC